MSATPERSAPDSRDESPDWPSALPLAAAAARLDWSARTLRRRLKFHGIPTIGSGGGRA
jgi:hypothetical protein